MVGGQRAAVVQRPPGAYVDQPRVRVGRQGGGAHPQHHLASHPQGQRLPGGESNHGVGGTGPPGGPAALHCHLIVRDGGIELSQQLTLPLGRLLVHLLEDIGGDCLGEIAEGDQGVGLISPRRQDRAAAEAGTGQAEGGDPHAPFLVLLHPMYSFSAPPQPGRGRAMGERLRVPRRPRVPGRAHFYTIVSG